MDLHFHKESLCHFFPIFMGLLYLMLGKLLMTIHDWDLLLTAQLDWNRIGLYLAINKHRKFTSALLNCNSSS